MQEEGTSKWLFDKAPTPPPPEIQNSTASPSAPWDPIKTVIFNAYSWSEDIALVRNQLLDFDDDMESSPNNFPLFHTPAADTLFEGKKWG